MNHSIKINRAFTQSIVGPFPAARDEALALIPESILSYLSSTSVAALLNALHESHQAGRRVEAAAILDEGAIFDPRKGKMREISA